MLEKEELLPFLINKYGCKSGVEVGVRGGENAARLLQLTSMYLYGVDINRWPQIDVLEAKYSHRFKFYHMPSDMASDFFCEESLDFIYIDADHKIDSVAADLKYWYPKLKVGGVFCGDDYCSCWNPLEGAYGIVEAVEAFIADKDVDINISGLGEVPKYMRLEYAKTIGALHEANLILGAIGHVPIPDHKMAGLVRTEGVPVPQWWFIKE
jgi:hypothetical protein